MQYLDKEGADVIAAAFDKLKESASAGSYTKVAKTTLTSDELAILTNNGQSPITSVYAEWYHGTWNGTGTYNIGKAYFYPKIVERWETDDKEYVGMWGRIYFELATPKGIGHSTTAKLVYPVTYYEVNTISGFALVATLSGIQYIDDDGNYIYNGVAGGYNSGAEICYSSKSIDSLDGFMFSGYFVASRPKAS